MEDAKGPGLRPAATDAPAPSTPAEVAASKAAAEARTGPLLEPPLPGVEDPRVARGPSAPYGDQPTRSTPAQIAEGKRQANIRENRSMLEYPGGPVVDPEAASAKAAARKPPETATVGELFKHAVVNNIISGPPTTFKVLSNAVIAPIINTVAQTATDLSPLAITGGRARLRVPQFDRVVGRGYATLLGYAHAGQGLAGSIRAHYSDPHYIGNRLTGLPGIIDNRVVKGYLKVGDALGAALHQTLQTGTDTIIRTAEFGGAAGEQATKEAQALGKRATTMDWLARMVYLSDHPEELSHSAVQEAIDTGADAALRRPLGRVGQQTSKWITDTPMVALAPITRIPMAAASKVMEHSPLGAIDALLDVMGAKKLVGVGADNARPYAGEQAYRTYGTSTTPLKLRMQHAVVGTALAAWLISKAGETSDDPTQHPYGWVTGSGPDDGDDRKKLEMKGWKADSVWFGNQYRAFKGWHGLAAPLAAAGNWHDAAVYGAHGGNQAAFFQDLAGRMAAFAGDETLGLPVVAHLYDMLRGGPSEGKAVGLMAGDTIANDLIPAVVRGVASAADSQDRSPETLRDKTEDPDTGVQQRTVAWNVFLQTIKKGIPGQREEVPVTRDPLGRPVANASQGLNVFLPKGRVGTADPVGIVKAFVDADVTLPSLETTIYTANDGASIALNPVEAREIQRQIGTRVTEYAQQMIHTPEWPGYSTEIKHDILTRMLGAARRSVSAEYIEALPPAERQLSSSGGRLDPSRAVRMPVTNKKYPNDALIAP